MKDSRHDETKETESGDTLPGKLSILCTLSIFPFIPVLDKFPNVFK